MLTKPNKNRANVTEVPTWKNPNCVLRYENEFDQLVEIHRGKIMMSEIGQDSVDFASLVGRAAEDSYMSLKELVDKSKSSELSDSEKKIMILKYIVKTQQRMLRLNVLSKWCQQVVLTLSSSWFFLCIRVEDMQFF